MDLRAVFAPEHLYTRRPYLAHNFTEIQKAEARFFHAGMTVAAFRASYLTGFVRRGMLLLDRVVGDDLARIVLCISPDQKHEGELSVVFHWNHKVIYTIGFNFLPGRIVGMGDPAVIVIGRMQGHKGVFPEIKAATKAFSEVSPQNALFAAIEGVALALGLRNVAIVSGDNCCSFKDNRPLEPFLKVYDEFLTAHGAEKTAEGMFGMSAPFPKKPINEVKPGHRLRARKKQEVRSDLSDEARRALSAALEPDFDMMRARRPGVGARMLDVWNRIWRSGDAPAAEKRALLGDLAKLEQRAVRAVSPPPRPIDQMLFSKVGRIRRWAERLEVRRLDRLQFDDIYYRDKNHDSGHVFKWAALHYARIGREGGREARFSITAPKATGQGESGDLHLPEPSRVTSP